LRFNFRLFFRLTYLALFKAGGTVARLTSRRVLFLALFYGIFPLAAMITWIGWLLDGVFFRGYRSQPVREPVFIVGNPRSGTTFLHRLMANDARTFTYFRLWEVLLAPSITNRKVIKALAAFDRRLGNPLHKRIAVWEARTLGQVYMHRMALHEADEDAGMLVYIWSGAFIMVFFPFFEEVSPYLHFDTQLPASERERIMAFYAKCLRRHLYAHQAGEKRLLSKNPVFSPMIGSLRETFPDAKIIYLARNPLETVPSLASYLDYFVKLSTEEESEFPFFDFVRDTAAHWYRYPLAYLEQAPPDSYIIVRYDDLVRDPEQTIIDIYHRFGFDISPEFAQQLKQEAEKARRFQSTHVYSLEEFGTTREQLVEEFDDIFERFGFGRGGP
jgi:hypothetical protein